MGYFIMIIATVLAFGMLTAYLFEQAIRISNWWKNRKRYSSGNQLYDSTFIDVKELYIKKFNTLPWMLYVGNIDANAAADLIRSENYGRVLSVYQRAYYCWTNERTVASRTIYCMADKVIIELGGDYAEIMYDASCHEATNALFNEIAKLREPAKEREQEINIITNSRHGLELKAINIKPVALDIGMYYNDDFAPVDKLIKERLGRENDKGIILLHGLPGTGKTTYLRHLIANIHKRVLFVSPMVAENLMSPEFIELLIDNPNSILVIEDAESIITDRRFSKDSSVSNLLNLSDGLMSDFLNVQIVCTFNSPLTMVDSALLRKGRLIAKYEFGKLTPEKSKALSEHLKLEQVIDKPMTLAEITNPDGMDAQPVPVNQIGFRRNEVIVN